ncbi:unnamed protein product [Rhodiola kirilowii]
MASSNPPLHSAALLLLCFCSVFSNAKFLSLPVFKHAVSGRFVARIFQGTHQRPADLVVDLGGSFTGLDCRGSSTQRVVSCPSLECSKAGESSGSVGELVEDAVAVGSQVVDSVNSVDRFLFYCMPKPALRRLPGGGASGVLGLGRSKMSLPSQFSMTNFLDRKFTICLSASDGQGQLLIGDALSGTDISKTLIYTPLITSKEEKHLISVNSIKIEGDPVPVKVNGRARLSTTAPFTTFQSSIYHSFTEKFVKAVNATKAESVWPLKTCFVSGTKWPEVDLVLQSKMVKWRIGKRNLVVQQVSKGVSCLGILDGGYEMGDDEIVIGRYQLEEKLLEFDMGRSMLGFKSDGGMSCGELKLESGMDTHHPSF